MPDYTDNDLHQLAHQFSFRIEEDTNHLRINSFFNWKSRADLSQLFYTLFVLAFLVFAIWNYEHNYALWLIMTIAIALLVVFVASMIHQVIHFVEIDSTTISWRSGLWRIERVKLHRKLKLHIMREDYEEHSRRTGTSYHRDVSIDLVDGDSQNTILLVTAEQKEKWKLDRFINPIAKKIKTRIERAEARS